MGVGCFGYCSWWSEHYAAFDFPRVQTAEADSAEIESLSKIITQNQAEIGRLNERLTLADKRAFEQENRYNTLYEKYDKIRDEFENYKLNHK